MQPELLLERGLEKSACVANDSVISDVSTSSAEYWMTLAHCWINVRLMLAELMVFRFNVTQIEELLQCYTWDDRHMYDALSTSDRSIQIQWMTMCYQSKWICLTVRADRLLIQDLYIGKGVYSLIMIYILF